MIDFIKKLEKKLDTQIIHSEKRIKGKNYFNLDSNGNVKTLSIWETDLKDLNVLLPIADNLVELDVGYCNIKTLGPLKRFSKLETLDLSLNRLHASSLVHLNYLKNLKKLNLGVTNLKDTSPLSNLTNLEKLCVSGSDRLYEVKGLEKLKSLEYLDVGGSPISSIKKINAPDTLRHLSIRGDEIEKLAYLDKFPNLESFVFEGDIEKIEGLDELQKLKELFISGNGLKKIEGLDKLQNLEILDLSNNLLKEIRGLDALVNLKQLNLNENEIVKIENLDNLTKLELLLVEANYNLSDFDTQFLQNLESECHIYIRGFKDSDKIKSMAPENVKINFKKDYPYPMSLYFFSKFYTSSILS